MKNLKKIFQLLALFFITGRSILFPVELKAQDIQQSELKERGYYLPTRITITYNDQSTIAEPGIPEWLAVAVNVIRELYPKYDKYLETEGHIPSGVIELRAQSTGPIGWNSSTTIGFNIDYIKPGAGGEKDWGMIAHELVHFIQNYQGGQGTGVPGWITEGIGDYVRHAIFEPEKEMRPVNPDRAKYTDAYQVSAGFLMWIAEAYDKDLVPKLNMHGRKRTYSDDVFEEYTGKKLDDLWAEYIEKIIRPLQQENKRLVPAIWFPKLMQHLQEFEKRFALLQPEQRPQEQQGEGRGQGRGQRPQGGN